MLTTVRGRSIRLAPQSPVIHHLYHQPVQEQRPIAVAVLPELHSARNLRSPGRIATLQLWPRPNVHDFHLLSGLIEHTSIHMPWLPYSIDTCVDHHASPGCDTALRYAILAWQDFCMHTALIGSKHPFRRGRLDVLPKLHDI